MLTTTRRAWIARAIALGFACAATTANAAEVHIKIDNFTFTPDSASVKPGDTVVWENADDIPHTVASTKPGAFRSKALDTDDRFSFTFAAAGTFEYFCGLHPHMKGKIIVAP